MTKAFHEIPIKEWPAYEQLALERLHLKLIDMTSRWLLYIGKQGTAMLFDAADENGHLDLIGFYAVMEQMTKVWQDAFPKWLTMFNNARWEAALLALSHVARLHVHYFPEEQPGPEDEETQERGWRSVGGLGILEEAGPFGVTPGAVWTGGLPYQPALDQVVDSAVMRLWHDGRSLSDRIWSLNGNGLDGIRSTLYNGMMGQKSIVEIAKDLEKYLGAGAECPRWTAQRLSLTPEQIEAGDQTGLVHAGTPGCQAKGVSYNALRLARTEVQAVHSAAVDKLFAASPFVTGERVYLNDMHPGGINCACEELVGYPGSTVSEVMPVGTVFLPLHPNCLCYKLPETLKPSVVGAVLAAGDPWPAMDEYKRQMKWPGPVKGAAKKLWWLLLLVVGDAYRRWAEAKPKETEQALAEDPDDPMWQEWR